MRVWDCDPSLLSDKHLRAQHAEVHFAIRCLEGGWNTRWKDVYRFKHHPAGLAWLGFVHEVTVDELLKRGKFKNHQTPVTTVQRNVLQLWRDSQAPGADVTWTGADYMGFVTHYDYPRTELNEGTPWDRDKVPFEWYREHEKDWSNNLVREYHRYE